MEADTCEPASAPHLCPLIESGGNSLHKSHRRDLPKKIVWPCYRVVGLVHSEGINTSSQTPSMKAQHHSQTMSLHTRNSSNWKLHSHVLRKLTIKFGPLSLHLFISFIWRSDPQARAIDSLPQLWHPHLSFLFLDWTQAGFPLKSKLFRRSCWFYMFIMESKYHQVIESSRRNGLAITLQRRLIQFLPL